MKRIVSILFVAVLAVASFSIAAEPKVAVENESQANPAAEAKEATVNSPVASKVDTPKQARRAYTRQEIRAMNILDRPNRPGHFYGNAVRRHYNRH